MRILLADDHRIVREGLKSLIEAQPDLEVVGEAADGREAVAKCREAKADVVVMDVAMPQLNGIEATRQIAGDGPGTKVVALSMHADRRFVSEALKAGTSGYVLKDGAFDELIDAIRTVVSDRVYLSPRVAGVVVEDYVRRLPARTSGKGSGNGNGAAGPEAAPAGAAAQVPASAFDRLTPREREVLQLMAEGFATKEVAHRLHVSVKTVETHRRQLMEKLDLHSVAELTKYAIREGLTTLD
ncbi:MAG TPA: response regulator transcription factor [Tepidisphaeraceae bacterium]|nr:response regulator transcription factor [Tepidisphaeraceae bacterium]